MGFAKELTSVRKSLAMIAALAISSLAHATTIYDESVLGHFNGGQLFILNDTHNVFVGSQVMGPNPENATDGFRFVVQSGQQATINFSYAYTNLAENERQIRFWDLFQLPSGTGSCTPDFPNACIFFPSYVHITSQFFRSDPSYGDLSSWSFVDFDKITLDAGTYILFDNYNFSTPYAQGLFSYSVDIEQSPVPIPSGWWLFVSGLASLMQFSRKRKVISGC